MIDYDYWYMNVKSGFKVELNVPALLLGSLALFTRLRDIF